jgi:hypothetical protein
VFELHASIVSVPFAWAYVQNRIRAMFAFQPAVEFTPRRLLFAFNTQKECDKWKLTTDAEYGGRSSASFTSENGVGVFRGYLDVDTSGTDMRQSGFCALTCPIFSPPLDLTEYAALQFRIRTNGGVFISNMKLLDGATDELFQCFMLPPAQRKPAGQQPRYVRRVSPYDVAEATAPVNTKTDWSDLTVRLRQCVYLYCDNSIIFDSWVSKTISSLGAAFLRIRNRLLYRRMCVQVMPFV